MSSGVPVSPGHYRAVWSAPIATAYGVSLFNKKHEASDAPAGKLGQVAAYVVIASSALGCCFPSPLKYLHCTRFIGSTNSYFASVSAPPIDFAGVLLLWL